MLTEYKRTYFNMMKMFLTLIKNAPNMSSTYDYINTNEFNEYSNVVYSTAYKDTFDNDIYFVEYKKN